MGSILHSRMVIPVLILLYGVALFGLRMFVLEASDFQTDVLLALWTIVSACSSWAVEIC